MAPLYHSVRNLVSLLMFILREECMCVQPDLICLLDCSWLVATTSKNDCQPPLPTFFQATFLSSGPHVDSKFGSQSMRNRHIPLCVRIKGKDHCSHVCLPLAFVDHIFFCRSKVCLAEISPFEWWPTELWSQSFLQQQYCSLPTLRTQDSRSRGRTILDQGSTSLLEHCGSRKRMGSSVTCICLLLESELGLVRQRGAFI